MKLILTAPIAKLGIAGDIVEVKDGYGRNYLLPQGKAIAWTRGADKQIEGLKRARDAREVRDLGHANELRQQIEGLTIELPARSGGEGRLFGAVTAADLALAVKKAGGPAVDKRSIQIAKPIKTVGSHTIGIKLHEGVTAHVAVSVLAAN
ncbi:50S ribosomal protein L9 [Aestuariimicrobium sp. T2.26MG-19.2B]|uniref:50S ribosomal protein L9 n=1 Tax=Aestuariimicrobium sp. T2.26MG-19.2B TaxID=3040679 RepID=UPI0024776D0C|nr:50S ribosomal protein L9 [Aestuariimicrobium sp. T2.26MG-19.2B]CAI9402840.1 50S ribosomal protein L9 [Aestuariimicrobium sp. T2.26MG-19.2B]